MLHLNGVILSCHGAIKKITCAFSEVLLQYSCLSEGLKNLSSGSSSAGSVLVTTQNSVVCTVCLNADGDVSCLTELLPPCCHFLYPMNWDYRLREIEGQGLCFDFWVRYLGFSAWLLLKQE